MILPRKYVVHYRDEFGHAGQSAPLNRAWAGRTAARYRGPRCWAAIVDMQRYRIVAEYGKRFGVLHP